jgi:hypothetical protein
MHIPLISKAKLLELYKFLPLPIHFNFSANISITPVVRQNNFLAIGHSKSFQTICTTDLPLPQRHLLLQGKESDGDKFEKVLLMLALPGQCRSYPDCMQIQGCGSFRADFRTSGKHLGSLLKGINQHKPGFPGQEHNPDLPNHFWRHPSIYLQQMNPK